jgi:peptidoglycan/xylan/chitin deacetylase (PgdA/CDA1 family)
MGMFLGHPVTRARTTMSDCILCLTCDVEIENEEDLKRFVRILEIFDRYHFPITFFLKVSSGNLAFLERVDMETFYGAHEFGLHIHWGESDTLPSSRSRGLKSLPTGVLEREIQEGLRNCMKIGVRPTSFRAGGLSQTTRALKVINKYGFKVDSSVAAALNEKEHWFQNHGRVPYRSWYFPSKNAYDIPASDIEDRMGILEIPVTRLIPSTRSWSPCTLTPTTPLFKLITMECLLRPRIESPLIITPIFHSWGDWRVRSGERTFDRFAEILRRMIVYLLSKGLTPRRLDEVYALVCDHTPHRDGIIS